MSRGFQRGRGGGGGFGRGKYLQVKKVFYQYLSHFKGRGGPRGGGFSGRPVETGPPDTVLEMGQFMHAVEDEMLCASVLKDKIPYFNAPIYLENKSSIGKVDEILGPINEVYFSIKMGEGMVASSFQKGDKVYIGADKLLPLERFLPKPKEAKGTFRCRTVSLSRTPSLTCVFCQVKVRFVSLVIYLLIFSFHSFYRTWSWQRCFIEGRTWSWWSSRRGWIPRRRERSWWSTRWQGSSQRF
ncbi:hypothetical protein M408DRAFT_65378 [Serendipita vermifera MAFF 305830]|uniref:H/ACA ribonucleoprotein complex subunit n=1 Tax=Serendipita vermifera MAFF 305830 TaxID=933852 RepID=A0A0C2WYB8_SERVB|nr:hypothetical protein M408DRAFT_65378 [Serendipita vermifera MAFF 305830]